MKNITKRLDLSTNDMLRLHRLKRDDWQRGRVCMRRGISNDGRGTMDFCGEFTSSDLEQLRRALAASGVVDMGNVVDLKTRQPWRINQQEAEPADDLAHARMRRVLLELSSTRVPVCCGCARKSPRLSPANSRYD